MDEDDKALDVLLDGIKRGLQAVVAAITEYQREKRKRRLSVSPDKSA